MRHTFKRWLIALNGLKRYDGDMALSKRVAIIVDFLETEYAQQAASGCASYLRQKGYKLLAFPIGTINAVSFNFEYQNRSVSSLINRHSFDGVIFLSSTQFNNVSRDYIRSYLTSFKGMPVVTVGCKIDGVMGVEFSGEQCINEIVSHLIEKHGRRNFALMAHEGESPEGIERERGFRAALKAHGIGFDESRRITGGFTYETAAWNLRSYREKRGKFDFDAIVALNDEMAFACMDVLKMYGIKVPEDVAVTGFDDELRSCCLVPSLTSVNHDIEKQGEAAARMLLEMIEGEAVTEPESITFKVIFRQSCGCVPLDDKSGSGRDLRGEVIKPAVSNVMDFGLAKWYANRNYFIQIVQHYSALQAELSLADLRQRINGDLITYGIEAAAVCLYEAPVMSNSPESFKLPRKARVFSAFDRRKGFVLRGSKKDMVFNPETHLIPEDFFVSMDRMCVCSLFNNALNYGYIVFKPGDFDVSIYLMLCKMLCSSISSAMKFEAAKDQIAQLKTDYRKIREVSLTDELTGLLNRRGFVTLGGNKLEDSKRLDEGGLLLYGDIDGLKGINDTYGHAAGDRAIKSEAAILKGTFRSSDAIARLGGDEFAVLAVGMRATKFADIEHIVQKKCDEYNDTSGEPFKLSISIGFTEYGKDEGYDINSLLQRADSMLYEKKRKKYEKQGLTMKIEAKFYPAKNRLYFLNGKEFDASENIRISAEACVKKEMPSEGIFYAVEVPWTTCGLDENSADEHFLSELRTWLKLLEVKQSYAAIVPVADKKPKTDEERENLTLSFRHCARRIKDCLNMIGFAIPPEADATFFQNELRVKHEHYIFFSKDEELLNADDKIVAY